MGKCFISLQLTPMYGNTARLNGHLQSRGAMLCCPNGLYNVCRQSGAVLRASAVMMVSERKFHSYAEAPRLYLAQMNREITGTHQKALQINLDPTKYGTFAEIGAGQEVARWFFRVGGAAGTIAKTMSAYDMTISDAI